MTGRLPRATLLVLLGFSCMFWLHPALATRSESTGPAPAPIEPPLAPLPKVPSRTLRTPLAAELARLDEHLTQLLSTEPEARQAALLMLNHVEGDLIPAAAERLRRIAEQANKGAMKELLGTLKAEAREGSRVQTQRGAAEASPSDTLHLALDRPRLKDKSYRDLVSALALSRIFGNVGSVAATRELVGIYVRFGEFLRVDTQLQLEKLQTRAAAALIEATTHPAPKIASWAKRELHKLQLSKPTVVVQRAEHTELADILRAYGATRDPDLARLVISFAGSSHSEVRRGSREGTAAMGEVAHWTLRDAYEKSVGKRPSREWSWDRCARELFRELDRVRLHDVYLAYSAGLTARQRKAFDEMREHFDQVLATDPEFENAQELAQGYLEYALAKASNSPTDASDALRRAHRLTQDEALKRKIQSLQATLDGERLRAAGVADAILFRRAAELDPSNERASRALRDIELTTTDTPGPLHRYLAALTAGLLGALAVFALLRKARGHAPRDELGTPRSAAPSDTTPPSI